MGKNNINNNKDKKQKNTSKPQETKAIDDIFSTIKTKQIAKDKEEPTHKTIKNSKKTKQNISQRKHDSKSSKKEPFGPPEQKIRRTDEGYRIYTYDELNIGKGGGTKLCPFDCDCCF